jgi:hypothetical protein
MTPPKRAVLLVSLTLSSAASASPFVVTHAARAEHTAHVVDAPIAKPEVLQKAMRSRVTVSWEKRSGRTIPASHCRHAPQGCDERLKHFATYLTDAGRNHSVDPWLLAAMAFKESGFNPFAMGSLGELGILQLHPKNPRSKRVRFVHDEGYRKRCRKEAGACQREVVERAAQLLSTSLSQCGGDMNDALGAYNTGRCGGNKRYAKRIMSERKALLDAAGVSG